MYRTTIILYVILGSFSAQSQYLHTPSDFQNIIKKSVLAYTFDSLSEVRNSVPPLIISKKSEFSIIQQDNSIDLSHLDLNKKTRKSLRKGNEYFSEGEFEDALEQYQKVYSNCQATTLLPRIAYCFEQTDNTENALATYGEILKLHPKDPSIHFVIARLEHESGNKEAAVQHINKAHLYDRNNTVYLDSLISIYYNKGWQYTNSAFEPEYQLYQAADSSVHIQSGAAPWQSYAACKAIWRYEPGYQRKMSFLSSSDVNIIEEKECLLNALISYEKLLDEKKQFPVLAILAKVIPEKRIDDFLLYELSSRQHPQLMQQLSEERLEQVMDYIVRYRVKHPVN